MKMWFNVTADLTGLAYLEPVGKNWTDPTLAYNIKVGVVSVSRFFSVYLLL